MTGAGIAIAAVAGVAVLLAAVLVSAVLRGATPGAIDLVALAAVLLAAGLALRRTGVGRTRTLGSVIAVVGIVSLAILVGLFWLLLQGWGRPY